MVAFFQHKNKSRLYPVLQLDFPAHLHRAVEFGYLEEGGGTLSVEGKSFLLEAGDVFLIFPDKVHLFENCTGIRGFLGQASPDEFSVFKSVFAGVSPASPVIKSTVLENSGIKELFQSAAADQDLEKVGVLHGYLSLLLGKLFPLLTHEEQKNPKGEELHRVLMYLEKNFRENLSRYEIARDLGISESTLSHLFSSSLHITLPTYLNFLRLEEAQRLLTESALPITAVVSASGFPSLRTMNRVFRAGLGKSPSEYRREHAPNPKYNKKSSKKSNKEAPYET